MRTVVAALVLALAACSDSESASDGKFRPHKKLDAQANWVEG